MERHTCGMFPLTGNGPLCGESQSGMDMPSVRLSLRGLVLIAVVTCLVAIGLVVAPTARAKNVVTKCKGGHASQYPCKGIDLVSHMPPDQLAGARIADVWGWRDPETKKEYAILGSTRGILFVDVTRPLAPVYLGNVAPKDPVGIWQELEIFQNHVYAVCDLVPCGLQIFDLTRLRGVEAAQPWAPDVVFPLTTVHTIDLNPDTGMLYANGTFFPAPGPQLIFDVNVPKAPVLVGMTADDGYSHDSLCRNYKGPDKDYKGKEICFNFNEDTVTIYDMSNHAAPTQIARVTYDNASYVHSGTLTKGHEYLVSTDEGDEQDHGLRSTSYIWDVRDLDKTKLAGIYTAKTASIDHNMYSEGDAIFHASYTAGLRILDSSQAGKGKLKEVAYFDIMPQGDEAAFDGTWAAYPYLPSGNVLVGGMSQGLYIVTPDPKILKRLR